MEADRDHSAPGRLRAAILFRFFHVFEIEKTDLQDPLERGIVGGGILHQELVKLKAGVPSIETKTIQAISEIIRERTGRKNKIFFDSA